MEVDVLIKIACSGDQKRIGRCPDGRKLECCLSVGKLIRGGPYDADVNVRRIKRKLPETGHRENAKSGPKYCLVVIKRSVSDADPRLEVPFVEFAKPVTHPKLARFFVGCARESGVYTWAGIDRREKSWTSHALIRQNEASIARIEGA